MNPSRLSRTLFVVSLAVSMTVSVFLGAAIGVLAPFLIRDLGFSRTEIGGLVSIFAATGAIASPWAGHLTDRLGGRKILAWSFAIAGLMTLSLSLAPSYVWLFASMLVAGIVQSTGNPATNQLIAFNREPGTRGSVIGIKQSGVQVSYVIAGVLIPFLAVRFGWRASMAIMALLPFLSIGMTLALPKGHLGSNVESATPVFREPRTGSDIRVVGFAALLMGAGISAFMAYLPLYAHEELHFTVATAGAAVSLVGFLGVLFRILWGSLGERSGNLRLLLAGLAFLSALSAGLIWASQTWVVIFWIGVIAAGASSAAWSAVSNLAAVVLSDHSSVGRASAIVALGFFSGFAISPPIFGYLVDVSGSYAAGWLLILACFFLAAVILTVLFDKRSEGS